MFGLPFSFGTYKQSETQPWVKGRKQKTPCHERQDGFSAFFEGTPWHTRRFRYNAKWKKSIVYDDADFIFIRSIFEEKIVGSRNLLRKYIGKESIRVDAYKIDQNSQNAGYRSWEQTQINNSGAEKFVIYFAVILSLMNYTRGDFGTIRDKDLRSTLILDNPFGATVTAVTN